jgi:hypothetical protein
MKTICFELEEGRIYRGEGTVTFTCYYPYARTPKSILDNNENSVPTKVNTTITYRTIIEGGITKSQLINTPTHLQFLCGIVIDGGNWSFTVPRTNKSLAYDITITYYQDDKKKVKKVELGNYTSDYTFDFGNKKAYIERVEYNLLGKIGSDINPLTFNNVFEMYNSTVRYINSTMHGDDQCYRRASTSKTMQKPNPKIANDYSAFYYPTKREWVEASGLPLHSAPIKNTGDLSIPFKVTYKPRTEAAASTTITVNGKTITFNRKEVKDYVWDSKIGIVSKDGKAIAATGEICYSIPVEGNINVSTNDTNGPTITIDYDFWYY